jgi:ATP-binding cassette, subfamily B, bacterial
MFNTFPFFKQHDAMDCGPTCLRMIAQHHGKSYSLAFLRERSYLSRDGVSMLGISEAAENIGFRAMAVKIPYVTNSEKSGLIQAPLPCIVHWQQRHFVVVHKISKSHVWVADPADGAYKIPRAAFEASWISDKGEGVAMLVEPTPKFYEENDAYTEGSPKPKGFSFLFAYLKPFRPMLVQVFLAMLLGSIFQLLLPFLTQSIVDIGISNRNIGFIWLILMGQLILFTSRTIVDFIQNKVILHISTRINVALINDYLTKLMRLPLGFFDTKMTGDLMQRIGDHHRIEEFLTGSTLRVLFSAINLVVFSFVLCVYNVPIFLIFLLSSVIYVAWIVIFQKKRKEMDYARFQQASQNQDSLIELIQGMAEIKLQGSERKRRWAWADIQAKMFKISLKSLSLGQYQDAGALFINQTKDIIITVIAAKAVIEGSITLGMMLAIQYIIGQLNAPLQQFIGFIRATQDAKISLERLSEIHSEADEENNQQLDPRMILGDDERLGNFENFRNVPTDTLKMPKNGFYTEGSFDVGFGMSDVGNVPTFDIPNPTSKDKDMHIENLSFKYNSLLDNVLEDVSFTIPKGKVTAIVGTSGSGKTTLIKLLLGFYNPTKGKISVGGMNLNNFNPRLWRQECGTVMQDGFIFSDTIANNIAESDDKINRTKLLHAVKMANIQDFIAKLPLGYNTVIGAKGNGISQGQKQRLLIARAIYKNPNFLFFDEATNALDANNEKVIITNMKQFYKGKTVVVVAHRLSTVRYADQIIVMENGKVVEIGTHAELVDGKKNYYELVRNQLELGG